MPSNRTLKLPGIRDTISNAFLPPDYIPFRNIGIFAGVNTDQG